MRLPRGKRIRRVRALVAGEPVRTKVRGRRVKLRLPPGTKGTVPVTLHVRREGEPKQTLQRALERCPER
jgi:hypothetical protein